MERESLCQALAELHGSNAIADAVQARRPDADAHQTWHHDHDGAADARLGRQPDRVRKLSALVVHAATEHGRQRVAHHVDREDALSRHGLYATVGEGRSDGRHVTCVDLNGAVLQVELQLPIEVLFGTDATREALFVFLQLLSSLLVVVVVVSVRASATLTRASTSRTNK